MKPLTIVIAYQDPRAAQALCAVLQDASRNVTVARSAQDLRQAIARTRPTVAVLDLESVPLSEVEALHREFARLSILCTHRLADERMWASALAAGASDCLTASDLKSIAAAVERGPTLARSSAA